MIKDYLKRIRTTNINPEILALMLPFFARLKERRGVEGIVSLGGLAARGFSDIHSDVDASIFVTGELPWLPMFEFYVPSPRGDYYEINVHQNTLAREYGRDWEEGKKEAYTEGEIVYDPEGKVHSLISEKVVFDEELANRRMRDIAEAIASFRSVEPKRDHLSINKMLNQVVELAYLANREFRPHKKWRLEKIRYLPGLPPDFLTLLEEAFLVKAMTEADVGRRKRAIDDIVNLLPKADGLCGDFCECDNYVSYDQHQRSKLLTLIFGQLYWLVDVNPCRQIERGFVLNAHDLLNEGLGMAFETFRIMKGERVRQCVEALQVLHPHPSYEEANYALWTDHEEFSDLEEPLQQSLFVSDLSEAGVRARVTSLRRVTHAMRQRLIEKGLISKDPYHFAVSHCYFDRQLIPTTFAESYCRESLSEEDQRLLKGFICYHLAESEADIRSALKRPLPAYSSEHLKRIADLCSRK